MAQAILKGHGMHTPKQTAPKLGALPRYQSGGLIGKIKGIFSSGPEETMTQKFARQDAERAAKAAKSAPASSTPAPTAAPATPSSAIGSYAADSALKEREAKAMKAAGLKKGGAVRGPGTGTSDDVPIMASNGEFMIKASAVRKLGLPLLNAINEVGDSKKEEADDSMEDKKSEMGMKKGGAVRCMASGGAVRKEMMTGIPHMEAAGSVDEAQRRAQMLAQIPTGGYNPAPPAQPANWNTDTDLGRNINTTLGAIGPVAPLVSGIANARNIAFGIKEGAGLAKAGMAASGLAKLAPYGVPAAGLGALSMASSPSATPVQSPVVPQAATNPAGTSPASPSPFAGTPHEMGPQIDTDAPSLRGRPGADVAGAPGVSKFVENGKTLYSNVAGDNAAMMDKKLVGIVPGGAVRTLGSYGGGADTGEALQAARMAAVERGDIEGVRATYGGNFGGKTKADYATDPIQNTIRNLANGPMTAKRAAAMAQLQGGLGATIAGQGQASSSAAASQLARDKFGVDAKSAGIDQQGKVQLQQLQSQYLAEEDPVKKAEIVKQLGVLQNHFEKPAAPRHLVVPGGQAITPEGQAYTTPSRVFNPDTQQFIEPPQSSQKPEIPVGTISTVDGKKAKYMGNGKWERQ